MNSSSQNNIPDLDNNLEHSPSPLYSVAFPNLLLARCAGLQLPESSMPEDLRICSPRAGLGKANIVNASAICKLMHMCCMIQ